MDRVIGGGRGVYFIFFFCCVVLVCVDPCCMAVNSIGWYFLFWYLRWLFRYIFTFLVINLCSWFCWWVRNSGLLRSVRFISIRMIKTPVMTNSLWGFQLGLQVSGRSCLWNILEVGVVELAELFVRFISAYLLLLAWSVGPYMWTVLTVEGGAYPAPYWWYLPCCTTEEPLELFYESLYEGIVFCARLGVGYVLWGGFSGCLCFWLVEYQCEKH